MYMHAEAQTDAGLIAHADQHHSAMIIDFMK